VVGIALCVPGDRRVTACLPVLTCNAAESCTAGEPHRNGSVGPRPPLVQAVRVEAVTVASSVIVGGRQYMVRLVGVLSDGGLVVSLPTPLKVQIGQVQAVLIDLDVGS